jgi:hypothetical protein
MTKAGRAISLWAGKPGVGFEFEG